MPDSQQSFSYSRAPFRYSSHSKRHASFNSPREVPLPSPTLTETPNPFSFLATAAYSSSSKAQDAVSYESATAQRHSLTRQLSAGSITPPTSQPRPSISRVNSDHASLITSNPSAIYPTPRPFSLPQSVSYSGRYAPRSPSPPTPSSSTEIPRIPPSLLDRFSSASLPLPSQIPFHTLQKSTCPSSDLPSVASVCPTPEMPSATARQERSGIHFPSLDEISSSSSSSSSGSRDSINTNDSSINTESSSSLPPSDKPSSPTKASFESRANDASASSGNGRPQPRPISPFRAPQPPTQPRRVPTAADFNTAMRRFMAPAQPSPSASVSYPPPEPPVILPAEPSDDMTQPASRSQAPYVPFLSHAPPPPDSWIQVETSTSEYRLIVRLPGFSREGITLATKRRRILHVVADSWDNGGGHFERRISFGYDADLVQVRAEFDGVMLRIVIPRRASPVVWQSPRSGPVGRA